MAKTTKPDKTRRSAVKSIRDKAVMQKALEGKGPSEIAKEVGLTRQTVSGILNSDEMKEIVAGIDRQLAGGIQDAIKTVLGAVKNDFAAARDLLRNFGSMKNRVEHEHKGTLLEDIIGGSFAEPAKEKKK